MPRDPRYLCSHVGSETRDLPPRWRHGGLQAQIPGGRHHRRRLARHGHALHPSPQGKQMRPMFVFLSARLHGGVDAQGAATDRAHTAAALIELLHTATLVHDDVVDESPFDVVCSASKRFGRKKVAVLVGDYLLSRGLLAAVDAEAFDLLKITSRAVREMSEGELLQIEKPADSTSRKRCTSTSFAARPPRSSRPAAHAAPPRLVPTKTQSKRCGELGERVGLASKSKDDLLDLGEGRPNRQAHRPGHPRTQDDAPTHPHAARKRPLLNAGASFVSSSTKAKNLRRSKRSMDSILAGPAWSAPAPRCVA